MVAERAGECFVRTVVRLQRERKDIGRTVRERTCGFAQSPGPHIADHGETRRRGERTHHVKSRDTGDAGDLIEVQLLGEMAFDKPERLLSRIHATSAFIRSGAIMIVSPAPRLTVLAGPSPFDHRTHVAGSLKYRNPSLATPPQSCILIGAFYPTAHRAALEDSA